MKDLEILDLRLIAMLCAILLGIVAGLITFMVMVW